MLFSNIHKRLAKDLAQMSVSFACDEAAQDLMLAAKIDHSEMSRFVFNLVVGHTIICMYSVNLILKFDGTVAQKVLDPFYAYILKNLNNSNMIKVGDYILHKKELAELHSNFSLYENSNVTIPDLFSIVYEIRGQEYYKRIAFGLNATEDEVISPMAPLAEAYIRNHYGIEELEDNCFSVIGLSIFFWDFFKSVSKYCRDKLK